MVEKDLLHYTITGAEDWEMFVFLFKIIGGVFAFMWVIVVGLISLQWRDLKTRIAVQRKDDRENCRKCQNDRQREYDAIWDNIKACCKAAGVVPLTKKDLMEESD